MNDADSPRPLTSTTARPGPAPAGLRIALLEDLAEFAERVIALLTQAGHVCHWRERCDDFTRLVSRESFDLAILDWQLPDGSGEQVLQWMRGSLQSCPPLLFLTSRSDEHDIAHILDLGADDYLVKPVGAVELLARVRAVARRGAGGVAPPDVIEIGNLRVDGARREIRRDGRPVELSPKEYAIATLLLRNLGRLLSREHIYETAWGRPLTGATRTIDTHVSGVRVRLGLTMAHGWRLSSVYQHGYRLEAVAAADDLAGDLNTP